MPAPPSTRDMETTKERQTPKVGQWLPTFHPDGQVQYQGKVLTVGSADCWVQLYSFIMGEPNGTTRLPRADMADSGS